jgi:hypothetical protein
MSIFDGGWDELYWFLHNCLFISALITFCQVCAGQSLQHVSLILRYDMGNYPTKPGQNIIIENYVDRDKDISRIGEKDA